MSKRVHSVPSQFAAARSVHPRLLLSAISIAVLTLAVQAAAQDT